MAGVRRQRGEDCSSERASIIEFPGPEGSMVSEVIEAFYEAALGERSMDGATRSLREKANASAALVVAKDSRMGDVHLFSDGVAEPYRRQYREHWIGRDPWYRGMGASAEPSSFVGDRLVPVEEIERSAFYERWMAPQKLPASGVCVGYGRALETALEIRLFHNCPNVICLRRDQALLTRLLPHMGRALANSWEVASLRKRLQAMQALIDRLPIGVALVRRDRRVVEANQLAGSAAARAAGLNLDRGRVRFVDAGDNGRLADLLDRLADETLAGAYGALDLGRHPGPGRLSLIVQRLAAAPIDGEPVFAVYVCEMEKRLRVSARALRRLYGFSRVQAEVAAHLVTGKTLQEIADERGLQRSTIRSHVDGLFARTGTRRQSELVHFLLSSPAVMRLDED